MADEPAAEPATTEPAPEPPKPEDRTFTQADLDRVVSDRLDRERKKYEGFDELKAKAAQYDELAEKDKSESEKLAGKLTKAEGERDDARSQLLRFTVAQEKEVPAKLVPLLTATSREDLESQADLILENAKPADPDFDGGPREPAPEPKTPNEAHQDFLRGLFSPST